ncbi:unnamed protein product, partial [Cylindrotheca closterium]
TRQHWDLWQTTLSRALLASNGPHHPLQQPLGPWTDRLEDWNWLLSPTTDLFHRHGGTWKHFSSEGSPTTSRRYAPGPSHPSCPWWTAPLPSDALRATVRSITGSDRVLLTGTGRATEPSSSSSPSILHAWQTAAELCTDYYGWVPNEIEVHGDEATLADALLDGRLRVISDGSFKNELGTAAENESEIAWDTMGRAMRSLPAGLQRWSTKHCVGMCGTGKFKVLWGLETSAACPRCGDFEDHLHVPRCSAASATAEWDRRTAAFSAWLDLQLTGPSIKIAILQLLQGVHTPPLFPPRPNSSSVWPAFLAQQVIGSQGLLEGRIASSWLPLQQQYYDKIRCRRSVSLWASRLSQQLISIGFYMWEQRNSVQHSDDNVQLRERHSTVNEGIHSQFDMGPDDLPKEIQPMLTCRRRVLRKSLVDKEEWLKLLRQERRDFRRSIKAQRRSLRTIFSPGP